MVIVGLSREQVTITYCHEPSKGVGKSDKETGNSEDELGVEDEQELGEEVD